MVTAKIGGSSSPWTKRHSTIASSPGESATSTVGTTSAAVAATMTRLRPSTSATVPAKGAMSATAKVVALTVRLTARAPARNSAASTGSSAWGA
jgi:hypothetical protein